MQKSVDIYLFQMYDFYVIKIQTERIQAARLAKGWTRRNLARAIRCSDATITRLEMGKHLRPGTLYSVCRELGITIESVLISETSPVPDVAETG